MRIRCPDGDPETSKRTGITRRRTQHLGYQLLLPAQLRPWFEDQLEWDASLLMSWAGTGVDADGPIGLEMLVAAAQQHHPE